MEALLLVIFILIGFQGEWNYRSEDFISLWISIPEELYNKGVFNKLCTDKNKFNRWCEKSSSPFHMILGNWLSCETVSVMLTQTWMSPSASWSFRKHRWQHRCACSWELWVHEYKPPVLSCYLLNTMLIPHFHTHLSKMIATRSVVTQSIVVRKQGHSRRDCRYGVSEVTLQLVLAQETSISVAWPWFRLHL